MCLVCYHFVPSCPQIKAAQTDFLTNVNCLSRGSVLPCDPFVLARGGRRFLSKITRYLALLSLDQKSPPPPLRPNMTTRAKTHSVFLTSKRYHKCETSNFPCDTRNVAVAGSHSLCKIMLLLETAKTNADIELSRRCPSVRLRVNVVERICLARPTDKGSDVSHFLTRDGKFLDLVTPVYSWLFFLQGIGHSHTKRA